MKEDRFHTLGTSHKSRLSAVFIAFLPALLPFLCFPFPTQDGPSHMENAAILGELLFSHFLPDYLEFTPHLAANWTSHILGAVFLQFFSPERADAITIALALFSLTISLQLFVRKKSTLFMLLPFLLPTFLLRGFYNFAFATALFFFTIAAAENGGVQRRTGILLFLTTFVHPLVGALGLGVLLLRTLARVVFEQPSQRSILARLFILIPSGLLLLGSVSATRESSPAGSFILSSDLYGRLISYISGSVIVSLTRQSIPFALLYVVSIHVLFLLTLFRTEEREPLRWYFLGSFLVYLAVPQSLSGITHIPERISFFPLLLCTLIVLRSRLFLRYQYLFFTLFFSLAIALFSLTASRLFPLSEELSRTTALLSALPERSTLLHLWVCHPEPQRIDSCDAKLFPFAHIEGYAAAKRKLFNLVNYEPRMGHFPFRYRDGSDPFADLVINTNGLEIGEPRIRLRQWFKRSGALIDTIAVRAEALDGIEEQIFGEDVLLLRTCYTRIPPEVPGSTTLYRASLSVECQTLLRSISE